MAHRKIHTLIPSYLIQLIRKILSKKGFGFLLSFKELGQREIWIRVNSLLISLAFLLPSLSWAFEIQTFQNQLKLVQFLGKSVEIPKQLASIDHVYQGQNRVVIHIQDLHCNYEVQKHIAECIDYLAKHHGLKLVTIEGASQPVNVSKISFPGHRTPAP